MNEHSTGREYHDIIYEIQGDNGDSVDQNQTNTTDNRTETETETSQLNSRASCCGVDLWDFSCGTNNCQCNSHWCFVQFGKRPTSTNNNRGPTPSPTSNYNSSLSVQNRIIIAMINCLSIAGLLYYLIYYGVYADTNKYRVCVVDGVGGFARAGQYCPILDKPDSKVECVVGLDRMDCLRRISKGKVDFAVFTAEDLVTATNSQIEVLVTNELRFINQKYEYSVVAIVSDESGINSKYDLQGKKMCHPGYGYESDWTNILLNFLEATVVPRSCLESLTLVENKIKASSDYFRAACKAGPWVSDDILDEQLKKKYPNLCALCATPGRCSRYDKYWGRRGPLYCLTDGVGDIAWVRLDDAQTHFGPDPNAAGSSPTGYSFLCPDGSKRPVNSSTPCVWVSKPWPVIASKRTSAQEIQGFINRLDHSDTNSWQHALLNLIESYHVDIESVTPIQAIESYLINTPGFQSANSFTGCHPPRSIRMCTTSNLENAKCGWIRESAAVYGIEPDFDCIKADNKTHCLQAVRDGYADTVLISPDLLMTAERDYKLKMLLYEQVNRDEVYETVAVVRQKSQIHKFADLRGKKACFPSYEGIAWNSMLYEFQNKHLLTHDCPYAVKAAKFFGDSCVPHAPSTLKKLCKKPASMYEGDFGALKCLILENADVAFISKTSLKKIMDGFMDSEKWVSKLKTENMRILCDDVLKPCEISWSAVGQLMVRSTYSNMAIAETSDALLQVDGLFGKYYKSITRPITMYGPFDGAHDVLFHDATLRLRDLPHMERVNKDVPSYNDVLKEISVCKEGSASFIKPSLLTFVLYIVLVLLR